MSVVGEQIKLARLRRNLSVAQVVERAICPPLTVSRIEKGVPRKGFPLNSCNSSIFRVLRLDSQPQTTEAKVIKYFESGKFRHFKCTNYIDLYE